MKNILRTKGRFVTYSFLESGSDERQYNAPFVELPVVGFNRTKYGMYKEYHTSADNLDFISPNGLQGSYEVIVSLINAFEYNEKYKIRVLCEPQLGKRGLYPTISQKGSYDSVAAMMNFIKYCDGKNDLFDISDRINIPINRLIEIVEKLKNNDLLEC